MKAWTPEEIRTFRNLLGLTQVKFADMLGVTRVYVVFLERGDRQPGKTMKRLLDCLERQRDTEK